MGGHSGILGIQVFISTVLLAIYVSFCQRICPHMRDMHENYNPKPVRLLQPLPIPCQVCDDVIVDFIEGLPLHMVAIEFLW